MKKESINTFAGGLVSDLNSLNTPNSVLTDCKNGTFLTFNGNELILQNDMGNTYLYIPNQDPELPKVKVTLSEGFIPIGINEYGGVIYIVSQNPATGESEIGSFPSPIYKPISIYDSLSSNEDIITKNIDNLVIINKLDEVIPLSDNILNPGDPFLISLDLENTEIDGVSGLPGVDSLSYDNVRKFYKPKLISITNNAKTDITEDVEGKIQQYTTNGINFTDDGNNFWFLPKPLHVDTSFQQYINNGKSFFYKNRLPGKLGLKFELEDIDLLKIYPNNFPLVERLGAGTIGDPYTYKLRFDSFYVEDPSMLKVNKLVLKYTLTDNVTGVTSSETTLEFGPFTTGTSGIISNEGSSIFLIDLSTNKNHTINYTITPSNTTYEVTYSNYIIKQTLDLNSNELGWGLNPLFKLDSVYKDQKIDPYNANSNYIFNLNPTVFKDIVIDHTPYSSTLVNYNHNSSILQNIKWFKRDSPTLIFNLNIQNTYEIYDVILNGINRSEVSSSIKLNTTLLTSGYWMIGSSGHIGPETSSYSNPSYSYNTNYNSVQLFNTVKFEFDSIGSGTSAYHDGNFYNTTINTTVNNLTGYRLRPQMNKVSSINQRLSKNDDIVTLNTNSDLLINGNFESGLLTPWTKVDNGSSISVLNTSTSFKQYYLNITSPQNGYKFSQDIIIPNTSKYYVLSFYAKNIGTISFNVSIVSGTSINTTTSSYYSDWKLYQYILKSNTSNTTLSIECTSSSNSFSITNIEFRETLDGTNVLDPIQAVITYSEDVILLKSVTNSTLKQHNGIYIPSSNYEMIDNFKLDSTFNYSIEEPSKKIPKLLIRE